MLRNRCCLAPHPSRCSVNTAVKTRCCLFCFVSVVLRGEGTAPAQPAPLPVFPLHLARPLSRAFVSPGASLFFPTFPHPPFCPFRPQQPILYLWRLVARQQASYLPHVPVPMTTSIARERRSSLAEEGEVGPCVSGGPHGFPDEGLLHLGVPRGRHECPQPNLTRWQGVRARLRDIHARAKDESRWHFCLDGAGLGHAVPFRGSDFPEGLVCERHCVHPRCPCCPGSAHWAALVTPADRPCQAEGTE